MPTVAIPNSSAAGVAWDLADLYAGVDDPRIEQDLRAASQRALRFDQTYRGRIHCPGGPPAALLEAALVEYEALAEQLDKPLIYASLLHAAKTDDPAHGRLLTRTREERTKINEHLVFFELEWMHLDEQPAQALLREPRLARFRHFLEQKRAWKPHVLPEEQELLLEETKLSGRAAWVRFFDELIARTTFPFTHNGETTPLSLQQINARLYDPDRAVRRAAAQGLTQGLEGRAHELTFLFNNLVIDQWRECTRRHFADPIDPRNLANEISAEVVAALMTAAERHHGTVQRYYRLKGRILGLDPLYDYDRYAPLFADQPAVDWPSARQIVQESYEAFSPEAGAIVKSFFERRWIDAELRPGKRGGAFSSSAVPSAHPYILMNFTDKLRDVMTLAHELGHGVHQYLSRSVGYLQCDTPLTTAEMASVFGEMLTFRRLQERFPDPRTRLAMLCSKIEDAFATVFRQVVLTRFEQSLYQARKQAGELPTEEINRLWLEANRPMHGDAVQLTPEYGWWWMYIGHFVHSPFYCYAYAFGELLVLALVQKHRQEGPAFVPKYLELLAAGGSEAPHVLLGRLGMDVRDPAFWELGLRLLEDIVREAESLAASL